MARARAAATTGPFRAPRSEDLGPVYLLYGEEDLLREEAVRKILDAAVPPEQRSFNLDIVQAADADIRDILARASAFPMMADRRAVVVRDIEKLSKDEAELLATYVEHPLESTVLILTSQKIDFRKKPFGEIRDAGRAFEFAPLKDSALPEWITKRVASKGRTIDADATSLLASLAGKSLRDLDQELDKLILYASDRQTISSDDVSAVVGVSKEYNIWELQRAVATADCPRAIDILTRMIDDGNGAPYFVVMFTSFFATLRRVQDLRRKKMPDQEIAHELQRPTYMLRDHLEATKHFSAYQIERALGLLLAVDEGTKSGGDDITLLQSMLVEILDPTPSVS